MYKWHMHGLQYGQIINTMFLQVAVIDFLTLVSGQASSTYLSPDGRARFLPLVIILASAELSFTGQAPNVNFFLTHLKPILNPNY